jgi:hypothetical protein
MAWWLMNPAKYPGGALTFVRQSNAGKTGSKATVWKLFYAPVSIRKSVNGLKITKPAYKKESIGG